MIAPGPTKLSGYHPVIERADKFEMAIVGLGHVAVAQPLKVSWVSGHPQKFKLGVRHPKKVKGEYQTY